MANSASLDLNIHETLALLQREVTEAEKEGQRVIMTSSFQTQSVPLLHLVSLHFPDIQICFLDTGFHFPETYAFKDQLKADFGLQLIELRSSKSYLEQRGPDGLFLYASDTDRCCHINKVEPLERFMQKGDRWISGVRRDQTAHRRNMKPVEWDAQGRKRIHPMLDWVSKDIYAYINQQQLPTHPLDVAGYESIGCVPCTQPCSQKRDGRWEGSQKTECGLHLSDDR